MEVEAPAKSFCIAGTTMAGQHQRPQPIRRSIGNEGAFGEYGSSDSRYSNVNSQIVCFRYRSIYPADGAAIDADDDAAPCIISRA